LHPDPIFKKLGTHDRRTRPRVADKSGLVAWCGYLLLVAPFLIWMNIRTRRDGAHPFDFAQGRLGRALPVYVLLFATYLLTIWQARWGYFFVLIFALALPVLLAPIKSPVAVWIAFVLSIFPICAIGMKGFGQNETQLAARVERRNESAQLRKLALSCNRATCFRFLRRGGFRPRSPIGPGSLEWPEVRTKASTASQIARDSFFPMICRKRAKFCRTTG